MVDLHGSLGFVLGVVRHVRYGVKELSDAVSAVCGDYRAAGRLAHPGDFIAQIPTMGANTHYTHNDNT